MAGKISGPALAAVAGGTVFCYAALKGKSALTVLQGLVQGKDPRQAPNVNPITDTTAQLADAGSGSASPGGSSSGGSSSGGGGSIQAGGSARQILQRTAASFGWTGAQWDALNNIEMAEAGYNPTIKNSSSGALGLAQALGHGTANTAGTLGNEYGGYGLSDAQARAANSGDAGAQALWMCRYIRAVYGTPAAAWAFHLAHNWY